MSGKDTRQFAAPTWYGMRTDDQQTKLSPICVPFLTAGNDGHESQDCIFILLDGKERVTPIFLKSVP